MTPDPEFMDAADYIAHGFKVGVGLLLVVALWVCLAWTAVDAGDAQFGEAMVAVPLVAIATVVGSVLGLALFLGIFYALGYLGVLIPHRLKGWLS